MKDWKGTLGFVLIGVLMLAYFWIDSQNRAVIEEEQRLKDSLEQVTYIQDSIKNAITTTNIDANHTDSIRIDTAQQDAKLVDLFGDFAMSGVGENKDYILENKVLKITLSSKGGKIKQIELKDYKKELYGESHELVTSPLLLLEDKDNKFAYQLPLRKLSTPVSTEDLYFKAVEVTPIKVVFRAFAGSPDKYFEQIYSLNEDYIFDYDINLVQLNDVIAPNTSSIDLTWVNYIDRIEKAVSAEKNLSSIYYKGSDKSPTSCSCTGDDEVEKKKPMEWVSNVNQFFNTTIMADDNPFSEMKANIEVLDSDKGDNLKRFETTISIPYNQHFGMSIYSGPNEFQRLSALNNDLEQVIPYGRSILGTINRWVIRPLFTFFSSFIGNAGIVILLVTLLVKMVLFPLTYKMLYSQAKMGALKPRIEKLRKKHGDDQQAIQMETMKLYRETGVNPFGSCFPMLIQMPIWIALYRFFPANIQFRQESFLWAHDLASFDVISWLPFNIPFYGDHVSLFTILWAVTTVIYSWYNSKNMDMSANPAMKYVQYLMPITFLFFFNSMAAGLTVYMFFSSLINIVQTIVTKDFIINKSKIEKELAEFKAKPKKKGGFRDRLSKAFEEAQKAQEARQKEQGKKKK